MAFLPSSRYAKIAIVEVPGPGGRAASIVKFRRLPRVDGDPVSVALYDRLDVIAHETYGDSTEYWHIADANTEIDATELTGRGHVIEVPEK